MSDGMAKTLPAVGRPALRKDTIIKTNILLEFHKSIGHLLRVFKRDSSRLRVKVFSRHSPFPPGQRPFRAGGKGEVRRGMGYPESYYFSATSPAAARSARTKA
jgi:hypothetical protein